MIKNENEINLSINESINNFLENNRDRLTDSKANIISIISNENTSNLIYNFLVENNDDNKKLCLIKIIQDIIDDNDNYYDYDNDNDYDNYYDYGNDNRNNNLNFIKSIFSKIWNIIYMPNSIFIKNHILELIKLIKDLKKFTYDDYNDLISWVINNIDKCYITNIYILLKIYEDKFFRNNFYNDEFFMKLFSVINSIYIKIKEDLSNNISIFINNYDKLFTLSLLLKYFSKIFNYFKNTNIRKDLFKNQLNYIIKNTDIIDFNFYCLGLNFNNYNIIVTNCEDQKILKQLNSIKSIIINFLKSVNFDEDFQNKIYILVEKVIIELKDYFILNINNLSENKLKKNDLINNLIIFLDNKVMNNDFFNIFKKYNEDIYTYIIIPSYILVTEQYKEFNDNPHDFYEELIYIFSYFKGSNFLVNITKLYIKLTDNIDNFFAISHQYITNITNLLLNNDQTFLEKYNKNNNFSEFIQKLNKENLIFILYCLITINSYNLRDNLFIEENISIYNIFETFKKEYTMINVVGLTFYLQITSKRLFSIDKLENIMSFYINFLIENMNNNILLCLEKIFYYILENIEIESKMKIFNNNNFLNKILGKIELNSIDSIKLLHLVLKNYSSFSYLKDEIFIIIFNFGDIITRLYNYDDDINEYFNFLITVSNNEEFIINNYDIFIKSINIIILYYKTYDDINLNQLDTVIFNFINLTSKFDESYWNILDLLLIYCGKNKNSYKTIKNKLELIYIMCKYGANIIINNTYIINRIIEFSIFKNKNYSKYNIFITIIIIEYFNSIVNYENVKYIFNTVKCNNNFLIYSNYININTILFFYWIYFKYKLILNFFDEVSWKNIINNIIDYAQYLKYNFDKKVFMCSTLSLLSEDLLKKIDENKFINIFRLNIIKLRNIDKKDRINDNSFDLGHSFEEDNIKKTNNKIIYNILESNTTIINTNEFDKLNYLLESIKAKESNFFDRYKFKFHNMELEFLESLLNRNYKKVYDEKNNKKWRKIVKLKK